MKKTYLVLSVCGFVASSALMVKVTLETGNILLWTDPDATISGALANDTSAAFLVDLFYVVFAFFIWSWIESKRLGMKKPWVIWVLTLIFGLAGTLPLFLYQREEFLK